MYQISIYSIQFNEESKGEMTNQSFLVMFLMQWAVANIIIFLSSVLEDICSVFYYGLFHISEIRGFHDIIFLPPFAFLHLCCLCFLLVST